MGNIGNWPVPRLRRPRRRRFEHSNVRRVAVWRGSPILVKGVRCSRGLNRGSSFKCSGWSRIKNGSPVKPTRRRVPLHLMSCRPFRYLRRRRVPTGRGVASDSTAALILGGQADPSYWCLLPWGRRSWLGQPPLPPTDHSLKFSNPASSAGVRKLLARKKFRTS